MIEISRERSECIHLVWRVGRTPIAHRDRRIQLNGRGGTGRSAFEDHGKQSERREEDEFGNQHWIPKQ